MMVSKNQKFEYGNVNDPCDPFYTTIDTLIRGVGGTYEQMCKTAIFNELPPDVQLNAIINGTLVPLLVFVLGHMKADSRDRVLRSIIEHHIPQAYDNAKPRIEAAEAAIELALGGRKKSASRR